MIRIKVVGVQRHAIYHVVSKIVGEKAVGKETRSHQCVAWVAWRRLRENRNDSSDCCFLIHLCIK
jgi:hypothetical protein